MQTLDSKSFERARNYLRTHARPLDRALFLHQFEGAPAGPVGRALEAYRNEDGGFGRALEPDFRLPDSSAMATCIGLRILHEIGAPGDDPLVRGAIRYLCETYDPERPGWIDVPAQVNDHPHAPWWQRDDSARLGPEDVWGNPEAEIVARFHTWPEQVPAALLAEVSDLTLSRLDHTPSPLPPYVALCYQRLGETAPPEVRGRIAGRLRSDARKILDPDPAGWDGNAFPLFWLVPTPDTPGADQLEAEVALELDREIARQGEDGAWEPRWSWMGGYPEAWEVARREWRGEQTLHTLRALRAWGRIEGL